MEERKVTRLRLEAGPVTVWGVAGREGALEVVDLGPWLDELIRTVHRMGRRLEVTIVPRGQGTMRTAALLTIEKVLQVYDNVEVRR